MNSKSNNYLKMLSVILIAFLLLGGLFYFSGNSKKSLISENSDIPQITIDMSIEAEDISVESEEDSDSIEDVGVVQDSENIQDNKSDKDIIVTENKPVITEKKEEKNISDDKIKNKLVSWGFTVSSGRVIDTIVLHSSYNALGGDEYDLDKLIAEYGEYSVAPHYLVDRKGGIYRLVPDKNIAYHAGVSEVPDGRTGVNNFSIGIEIMNTKTDKYEREQYDAVNWLIGEIKKEHTIKYILGHDEIAPDRKTDPWNFNWDKVSI
jgi:N-acetylmuramoyl-L-alanine amidase-like protein